MFDKGAVIMQGNATSFRGSGFSVGTEYPEGSEVVCRVLAMNRVGHILRVDLQDV